MKLTGIDVENFRCFGTAEFNFADQTVIRAMNGSGKSSLAEAIVWCLYGTNIFGKTKSDTILMQESATSMKVLTLWESENGQKFTAERVKPTKGPVQLLINGKVAVPGQIEGLFFPTVNEFLSVFIPGFFSSLEPKEAKAILAKYSEVTNEDVMSRLTPAEQESLSGIRFGMGYDSVEVFRKKVSAELKSAEAELLRLEGEVRAMEDSVSEGLPERLVPAVSDEYIQKAEKLKQQLADVDASSKNKKQTLTNLRLQKDHLCVIYNTIRKTLIALNESCPTCGQSLPDDAMKTAKNHVHAHNEPIKAQLIEMKKQHDEVVAKINELEQTPEFPEETLERWQNYVSRVEKALQSDKEAKARYDTKHELYENAKRSLEEKKDWVIQQQKTIDNLNVQLAAIKAFRFRYVQLQQSKLDSLFNKVRIVLSKLNEDGEMKDAFSIRWNDKSYRTLSKSEKVRCDVEIGRAIASLRMNPEPMPVFIDDAEGVQDLFDEQFDGQAIAAYVFYSQLLVKSREDTVRDIEGELMQMKALIA